MIAQLPVDAEWLVARWLGDDARTSALSGGRVHSHIPPDAVWPLVLVHQVGGLVNPELAGWVEECDLQVEVYGDTHEQVSVLMATIRRATLDGLAGSHPEGVVSRVGWTGMNYSPDGDAPPTISGLPRPRMAATLALVVHPVPGP